MITDPIADLLTRIRNAKEREIKEISMPSSKMLESIAQILEKEGFIDSFKIEKDKVQNKLLISLKYVNGMSAISHLERVSKPGLRIYMGYKEIPNAKNGIGITIVSTSKGLMTGDIAKKERLGGELLAKIW